jgi:hypothetical protein
MQDRTKPAYPAAEQGEQRGDVRPVPASQSTLMVGLIPIVDSARQLINNFGLCPYRVFLIHVLWPSGRRGVGNPVVISNRELLPAPKVVDMSATTEILQAFGRSEDGGLSVERISARYSEDDLLGVTPDLKDLVPDSTDTANVDFFYEVQEARPTSPQPASRRYVPSSVPMLSRGGLSWKIALTKQDYDRDRNHSMMRNTGMA